MKTLAIIVAAIVGLGTILMVAIHIWAYWTIWIHTRKLKSELHMRQRTMSRNDAKERIERNEGIILGDAPTIGWNVVRIWWSPSADFLKGVEPENIEEMASKEDIENHRRYIDLNSGTAYLVDGFVFTQRARRYLKKNFGISDAPFIPTGAVLFEISLKRKNEKAA